MENPVNVNGVTLELKYFRKFDTNISADNVPTGPLVNMSRVETGNNATPNIVTVLAYLPDNTLNPVDNTSGLQLQGDEVYLNYYGVTPTQIVNKDGGYDTVSCRDFRVEFNCAEVASQYDLYYVQFAYQLDEGTPSVDAILVRSENDDPETDRGTVTTPIKDDE
ncbi:hypothetical protein [Tenacibaculum caenipelagi]|uniref:Uncharacterized protein n=1 Tax=Tenacibaculum caenipelagi TaxID=1325435 RepID=A0A4R6TJS1_9FLAO|nr:hypothetical protein [Tenacibaculum caenipelagi]TDQ29748.1 hypothetical protein DFQ07_0068 [Tenacibaculum caenipelagi]